MRDLLPPIVLGIGLMVAAEARADDPPDCALEPIRCEASWGRCEREWAGCIDASRALARERDELRVLVLEQGRQLQRAEGRVRRQRVAGVVLGAVGTAVLVGGTAAALGAVSR